MFCLLEMLFIIGDVGMPQNVKTLFLYQELKSDLQYLYFN